MVCIATQKMFEEHVWNPETLFFVFYKDIGKWHQKEFQMIFPCSPLPVVTAAYTSIM